MKRIFLLLGLTTLFFSAQAQWSNDPAENNQLTDVGYYTNEVAMLPDGSFYIFGDKPVNDRITPFLYYFDKDANPVWENPIEFDVDSTLTWTKTMTHLMVDKDGNAIVAAQDLCKGADRDNPMEKYTVWKVNQKGEFLWDERGTNLHGETDPDYYPLGALKMTQLSDGSYIFAWMGSGLMLQRISNEGEVLWGSGKNIGSGAYPYVVDAGDGDVIVVYQSSNLMARRLDFEGNDIWAEPVTVFSGELNLQIPLWTYLGIYPAAGGFVASYYGFKGNDEHYGYISFVKGDGTHAFTEADEGLRIGYSDNWSYEPSLAIDEENQAIYAIWIENRPGTNFYQRFASQKISFGGELMWDPEGVELIPIKERAVGYPAAAMGPKGTVLFSFMEHAGVGISAGDPILLQTALMNPDGTFAWNEPIKTIGSEESTKYDVRISPYINDQWILFWDDCPVGVDNGYLFGQNIRMDGSVGTPVAIERASRQQTMTVMPNPVAGTARIAFDLPVGTDNLRISLCGMNGAVIETVFEGSLPAGGHRIEWNRPSHLAAGMYLLQMEAAGNVSYGKIILR